MDPLSTPPPGKLLLVDDEEFILKALRRVLRPGNWTILTASSGAEALDVFQAQQPDVVVSDYRMPGLTGIELLTRLKELKPGTQRILLTGDADHHALEGAINLSEVFRFVSKPWNDLQLLMTVRNAFEQHAATIENERLLALTQEQNRELRALNHELDQKVAERTQALQRAKREWELTFDTINRPVALIDTGTWRVQRANRAFAEHAGRELQSLGERPVCYRFLFGRDSPCPGCPLLGAVPAQGAQSEVQHGVRTFAVSVNLLPGEARAVCIYRDVTEERALTRSMIETEKMVSVGTLAGGVAHEINNPLGVILGFCELLLRKADPGSQQYEDLKTIERQGLLCKETVENLLSFARAEKQPRDSSDLNACIEEITKIVRHLLEKNSIILDLHLGENLPAVKGDARQLQQVFLNLITNAMAAMETGGTLTIHSFLDRSARWAVVQFQDTGIGIPPEHIDHIFEPFFTTKPEGQGTGLGLFVSYGIITSYGGAIDCASTPATALGKQSGTTFTVKLPISSK